MPASARPLPHGLPQRFTVTVHGTVFEGREANLHRVREGQVLLLRPDPAGGAETGGAERVWVHTVTGEVLGYLPPEAAVPLAPWLREGGQASGRVLRVRGRETPSLRRLVVEVYCGSGQAGAEPNR